MLNYQEDQAEINQELKSDRQEKLNLLLFLSGKTISLFGSAIYAFVIGLYLLRTTSSAFSFALNLALYTLPVVLFNPIAGVMADKFNKKILVVGSDLINGLFLFLIYLVITNFNFNLYILYLSTFVMTTLTVFFDIALEAAKPGLVKESGLVKINSQARVIESLSQILGPLLGGLIYGFINLEGFILINAISFLISALIEYYIDYQYNQQIQMETGSNKDSDDFVYRLKEGFYYIFRSENLRALVYIFVALNFFFNFTLIVPLPYLLNTVWKIDPNNYGIIQAAFPVGMILGAILTEKIMNKISYNLLIKNITFVAAVGVTTFALPIIIFQNTPASNFVLTYYSLLMFLSGISVAWIDVPANVIIQKSVPQNILGRVLSVKMSIIKIVVPISLLISSLTIKLLEVEYVIFVGALIFFVFNIIFFNSSTGRKFIQQKADQKNL
ncbi:MULTISPECIES: MFS transporter [Halanaerobium]|uniref:Predicted arabinose efflux permease, MFS family n=1 Tax=Halanaerobium kushneri TaxID=56779 RepID=A0A1N6PBK9_9FIRM|nr:MULTISPECIES: MFS transporter [Halanaerobium]RCW58723.1 putative MFS family arabinose efflux permease [Halanaerobium sp. ST460_2HS_T2]SIQ01667.1 Predicted arabinose efflux permease, MFS family [Halanaerobium kushneri]